MRVVYQKDPYIKPLAVDLIAAPVVIRLGDITEAAASEFSRRMTDAYNTGQPCIPVIIDSYGGDVYALLSILSDIESSRLPIVTICVGKAMSAGAILLAHGEPGMRFMDVNATVMIHEVGSSPTWSKTLTELAGNVSELTRLNDLLYFKMAHSCGHKDQKYFLKLLGKTHIDTYMDVVDASKHKIVDHMGVPEFRVKITSDIELCYNKPTFKKEPAKRQNRGKKHV